MNELDIAALNKAVQLGRCWQGIILCPNANGNGEYNLLGVEAQPFRKTKCAGKAGDNFSHSRQRMSGIRIPTLCQDYTLHRVQGTQYSTGPRLGRQKTVR